MQIENPNRLSAVVGENSTFKPLQLFVMINAVALLMVVSFHKTFASVDV